MGEPIEIESDELAALRELVKTRRSALSRCLLNNLAARGLVQRRRSDWLLTPDGWRALSRSSTPLTWRSSRGF